jgi:ribonuclease T2
MTRRIGAGAAVLLAGALLAGCNGQPGPSGSSSGGTPLMSASSRSQPGGGAVGERARYGTSGHRAQRGVAPGTFDFYLLTLSWSPEYCATHAQAPECAAHAAFVLHGLWPENADGSYPENCSNAAGPADPGQYSDIYPDQGLLEHEWATHGTCSGLGPDAYFQLERTAQHEVAIPTVLAAVPQPLQLTPQQIITDFAQANGGFAAGDFRVSCGNNLLTAVQACLTKELKATSCSGVKSCKANVVKVTPQGTASQ